MHQIASSGCLIWQPHPVWQSGIDTETGWLNQDGSIKIERKERKNGE
jgi:hypothetical protein